MRHLDSLSVVVPVRNRAGLIGVCLEHLLRAARELPGGVRVEIVVGDDASDDGTGQVVERLASSSPLPIRHLRLPVRRGPGGTRNAAIEATGGELVVFVDSDVLVVEEFLRAHLEAHLGSARDAVATGPVVAVPSVEAALQRPRAGLWDISTNPLDTANASVRRNRLREAGLFDARFEVFGWEDLDLGIRLMRLGLVRVRVPRAVAYHVKPPVANQVQLQALLAKERERGRMARHFLARNPELWARLAAQATPFHAALNWLCRMGGLVNEGNVLGWVAAARRRRLDGLGQVWLSGVLNRTYLDSLRQSMRAASEPAEPPGA